MHRSHFVPGLVLVAVLVGCGGGGGSEPDQTAPAIGTEPQSQSVLVGQDATFSVTATGTEPLTYQWTRDGVNVTGATSATYSVPAAASDDTGAAFRVTITNGAGSVTSAPATLTVNTPFDDSAARWVGTWATAPYLVPSDNLPPGDSTLDNDTLRQIVRVSIGGSRIRLRLSNRAGNGPVEIRAAHLALPATTTSIVAGSDRVLTFQGSTSTTIPAHQEITSDSVDMTVPATGKVTITLAFGDTPTAFTGHPGSRTRSFVLAGHHPGYDSFSGSTAATRWYYIQGLEVASDTGQAIAVLGDSITDGYGTTTDANNRWTDVLATRLAGNAATADVGVLNLGIGGTNVVSSGLARFDDDVLSQHGARWVIILYGVNDIGGDATAAAITTAYQTLLDDAHDAGLLVYGVPILPFKGSGYDTVAHEAVRQTVNAWIRESVAGRFDAVIDLDEALRDPATPAQLLPAYSLDWLHPNPAGYAAMGEAVDLSLFE